ncbi:MAG: bifunctional ornithine acetyltransferase/N-acetylglutamate synthase [Spirochaetales bacterium]
MANAPFTSAEFPEFSDSASYRRFLTGIAELPAGFSVSTARIAFTPTERPTLEPYRMNLSLILADEPTERFGAVFTRNAFPGAPVILGREKLGAPALQGLLINNKIANVRARHGVEDAKRLATSLGTQLGIDGDLLLSVSTGIIGWALPVPEMEAVFPELVAGRHAGSALDLAEAIMTTDSFPKVRRVSVGEGSIVGIAKGAGMIEPNMATMLVFMLTDVTVERDELRHALSQAVEPTFNAISVDSDMSTSDMAVIMSSGVRPAVAREEFAARLHEVCGLLASDVVRNGEGTGHVIEVTVTGLASDGEAKAAAKAVVNSPLVKAAVYGNDPNVGRLLSSLGDHLGNRGVEPDPREVTIDLGGQRVFASGAFTIDREKELVLSDYLKSAAVNPRLKGYPQHQRRVAVHIACGNGPGSATVLGSDLSDEYVHENADYRS